MHTREMTLDQLQSVSLDILCELHDFCVRHSIKYSLAGGTAIGAVRHHGFIPWDDDVDVCMLRDDYERFCSVYQNNGDYELFAPQRGNSFIGYARLCEMRRTEVHPFVPCFTKDTGIWIDIFPMDLASDDYDTFYARQMRVLKAKRLLDAKRDAMRPLSLSLGMKGLLHVMLRKMTSPSGNVEEMIAEITRLSTEESASCSRLTNYHTVYRAKEWYLREDFNDTIPVEFEGKEFRLMSGYDDYLRQIYGGYMQLPPEHQRVARHSRHGYMWKAN